MVRPIGRGCSSELGGVQPKAMDGLPFQISASRDKSYVAHLQRFDRTCKESVDRIKVISRRGLQAIRPYQEMDNSIKIFTKPSPTKTQSISETLTGELSPQQIAGSAHRVSDADCLGAGPRARLLLLLSYKTDLFSLNTPKPKSPKARRLR